MNAGPLAFLYGFFTTPRTRNSHPCQVNKAKRMLLLASSPVELDDDDEEDNGAGLNVYSRSTISSVPNNSAVPFSNYKHRHMSSECINSGAE